MLSLLLAFILFAIGGIYVYVADDPGSNRRAAVRRLGAFLYAMTVAAIVGGLALLVGIVWMFVGLTWQLATDSTRFNPNGSRLQTLITWPYEMLVYAITGRGSFSYTPSI